MNDTDTAALAKFNAEAMLDRLASTASSALRLDGDTMTRRDRFAWEGDQRLRPLHDRLVSLGWIVETSTHGSVYYTRGEHRLRLSNHEVPATSEREHAVAHGRWSWHRCGYQIISSGQAIERLLEEIDEIEEDVSGE